MKKLGAILFLCALTIAALSQGSGVGQIGAWHVVGNPTASTGVPTDATLTALLDGAAGSTNGGILGRSGGTWSEQTSNFIPLGLLSNGGAFAVACNPTNATAAFQACTPTQFQANIYCAPQISVFTSGSSATYTTPTCNSILPLYVEVEGIGGGGGGAGSGTGGTNGTAGNNTTVVCGATTLTGTGGTNGTNGAAATAGGAGGGATNGDDNITGGQGGAGPGNGVQIPTGPSGGNGFYGGGGAGGAGAGQNGGAGATNSGAGGGAGGTSAAVAGGSAGGAGGFFRKMFTSPPSSCTYSVGATAAAGAAGTSGAGAGAGAAGRVRFVARWQ